MTTTGTATVIIEYAPALRAGAYSPIRPDATKNRALYRRKSRDLLPGGTYTPANHYPQRPNRPHQVRLIRNYSVRAFGTALDCIKH